MKKYRNILVVRTDRVGDVILTTPALAALRAGYPKARISILMAPSNLELVEGNPNLDEVLFDDRQGKHRGFIGFLKLVREVKSRAFDAAFIFHTKRRTNLLCFLAGIPETIGYKNDKLGFLLTRGLIDTRPQGLKPEAEYCLDVLRAVGIPIKDPQLFLYVSPEAERWARRFFLENGIDDQDKLVAIHPGASCISKRWMPERFAEVADQLRERRPYKIVFIGSADNREIMQNIKSALKIKALDATGMTTLAQLAGLLKRCALLISNDSGPVHIAAALKVPVISIFGRNQAGLSPLRWGPLTSKSVILHKEVGCPVCLAHNCNINFKCLEEIKTQEVLEAVDALLRL